MTHVYKERFRDWTIPGPRPPAGVAPADDESLDALCGHWWIFQKKNGHRYSTDDVLCAWYASQWAPRVERYCDLGSGVGSVAWMVAWRRAGCEVVTVEAQAESFALQTKSIRFNGLSDRVTQLAGDLRDPKVLDGQDPFDLVTGSPPYWAEDAALAPATEQARGARLETRGNVIDYAATAARILAPGGVFALVHQASQDPLVRRALDQAELSLVRTRPVRFKAQTAASQSGVQLYIAQRRGDLPAALRERPFLEPPLSIRAADGRVGEEYQAIKLSMGMPP